MRACKVHKPHFVFAGFLVLLITFLSTSARAGWIAQNPAASWTVYAIHFPVDATTGFAGTGMGDVYKTVNGGINWNITANVSNITDIYFPTDATTGYLVGQIGVIYKTIDGGVNWTPQTSPLGGTNLRSVYFPVDATTGYITANNGGILKTTDGGANWISQTSGTAENLVDVHFPVNATTGYVVGLNGTILKTTDGGTNWNPQTSGTTNWLNSVYFPMDNITGYAAGDNGTILKTTDGGANWGVQSSGTTADLQEVYFPTNITTGYAVGTSNTILKTTDGGITWLAQSSGVNADFYSVHFPVNDATGYISGIEGLSGQILKTTDGGGNTGNLVLHPTSDSATSQFTATGGCSPNAFCVNDQPGDAGTGSPATNNSSDYLSGSSTQRVMFNLDDGTVPGGSTITAIQIFAETYRGNGSGANVSFSYQRMPGATTTDASPVDSSGEDWTTTCCTKRGASWTNLNWTTDDLDNLEIGLVHNSGGATSYVTQLYVYVTYSAGGGATTTIGDGTTPSNKTTPVNSTNNAVNAFTLSTSSGADTLTALTVTRNGTGADSDVASNGVKFWRDDGSTANEWDSSDTQIGSGVSFSSGTASFNSLSESINTTPTQYLITFDIASAATTGNSLLGAVTAATVSNSLTNNDTTDATLTVGGCQVVNTNDSGAGSLRSCITFANSNPGTTISFNIPTSDGGYQPDPGDGNRWWRIRPNSGGNGALPSITASGTIIDGATQTANQGDTNSLGPEIEINGASAGSVDGFAMTSGNNAIKGMIINGFGQVSRAGVKISGALATFNTIVSCYIGTNYAGTVADGNDRGIFIVGGAQSNTIGGNTQAERNIISGNNYGFYITSNDTDLNVITGNFIGTNASGSAALANNTYGIYITSGPGSNFIGGTTNDERNIISGNSTTSGIFIIGAGSDENVVRGNYIGTDLNGAAAVPNKIGITIGAGAQSNIIGGNTSGERNIIAGSDNQQIVISGTNTKVEGNNVGADVNGAAMGGTLHNIQINNTATGTIVQRNLIRDAAGAYSGINVGADSALLYHNTIDSNGGNGVIISSGVSGTIIRSNILSNNGQWGIRDNDLGSSTINTHNLYFNNSSGTCNYSCIIAGSNNVSGDPQYTGANDFTLTECTSPAINMGCDLGAAGDDTFCDSANDGAQPDMNGATAGNFNNNAPDMGAYETNDCDPDLTIVKQVWEEGGTAPLGDPTAPVGATLVFLIYVKNTTAGPVTDLRINDDLDEAGFDYVAISLRRTSDTVPPTDAASDLVIFNKSGDGTSIALTDAVDVAPATEVASAQDTVGPVGVDKITVGAVAGQANASLSMGAHETFALRFKVKVK